MALQFDRNDTRRTALRLEAMARRAEDMHPVWEEFGKYLARTIVTGQFASEGSRFGTPWKPLTPRYARAKRRAGFRGRILVRTGNLKESFAYPQIMLETGPDFAVYGSELDLAKWHQHGTRRNGKQINPPRPMLVIREAQQNKFRSIVRKRILDEKEFGL